VEANLYIIVMGRCPYTGADMTEDPIVAEIRRIRHEMDKEAGYDYDRYIEMLRETGRKRMAIREKQGSYGKENND